MPASLPTSGLSSLPSSYNPVYNNNHNNANNSNNSPAARHYRYIIFIQPWAYCQRQKGVIVN